MIRQRVQSSDLESIGYDEPTQTLEIEFHGGHVYQYGNVPVNMYEGLMHASSHGRFFNDFIKNHFQYHRV